MSKEEMFQAELLNHKLGQLEQELNTLDSKAEEIRSLKDSLDRFGEIKENEELLVPIARGVFASATSTKEKKLLINVGADVVVEKTAEQVHQMLDTQIAQLREYQERVQQSFNQSLQELKTLESSFQEK
ncbi:prefoldin subunit alpha [Candidatus Woesearchaeota archaeon]|nr:prefoldin subunit alpha [Candidatus Woesearchaeota archaeon]